MQPHFRRDRALIALLTLGLLLNFWAIRASAGRTFAIPPPSALALDFAGWKGETIPTPESTRGILPHAQIDTVRYSQNGQQPIDLVVIASRDPNDLHTPERCFTGFGFALSERAALDLRVPGTNGGSWTINRMVARSEEQGEELVLYLYDGVPTTGGSTILARIAMKLRGPTANPAYFVRLSTPTQGDWKSAETRLMDFAAKVMAARTTWQTPSTP